MVEPEKLEQLPCPVCGKTSYEWGTLTAQGLTFSSDQEGGLKKAFKTGFQAKARRCTECLNIQILK